MSTPRTERARIHGLYSDIITSAESEEISKLHATNIDGEIAYLRTICRRLAKIADENGLKEGATAPLDDSTIRMLNALDLKMNTLLRYVRTQAYLNGEPNEYDREIEEGEFLARKTRKVFSYLSTRKKAQPRRRASPMGDG